MLLLEGVTPAGGQESVAVNVIAGAGCAATLVVVLQPQPVTGVAVGVGAATTVGLGGDPAVSAAVLSHRQQHTGLATMQEADPACLHKFTCTANMQTCTQLYKKTFLASIEHVDLHIQQAIWAFS